MNDPLLTPLLGTRDAGAREREIERLMTTTTQPLARRILARYTLQPADAEDVLANVDVGVLRKLRAIGETEEEIGQLADYVAALTYNAVNDHLRRRHPERTRLKNRLRYLLMHDERLALWTIGSDSVAGLASWSGLPAAPSSVTPNRTMLDRARPADALVELFRAAEHPLLFDALLETAAQLWDVSDAAPVSVAPESRGANAVALLEQRDFLAALWREIRELPLPQRQALLLNLRSDEMANPIALLALTGTASFDDIAAAMEMKSEALAALWNDLPLDDLRIGGMLGISRQQVINLRKSARQRLARRIFRRR